MCNFFLGTTTRFITAAATFYNPTNSAEFQFLASKNKTHVVMVYNPLGTSLNSCLWYSVEDFASVFSRDMVWLLHPCNVDVIE